MKKLIATALLLLGALHTWGERITVPVNDNWRFRFAHQVNGEGRRVDLPHTWNAGDALAGNPDYYRGTGVYRRQLEIPKEWEGKRIFLRFEGANEIATVFVNDRFAGEHRGGYTAFVTDITDLIDRNGGKNMLTVKVNNALNLDIMPLVGDFNMYGGLYRGVSLVAVDPLHISLTDHASPGVYLTQRSVSREKAEVSAGVSVSNFNESDTDATLRITVSDGKRDIIDRAVPIRAAADSMTRAQVDFTIEKPRLWEGRRDPFICTATARIVLADGTVADSVSQPLGLRYFSVTPDEGFSLNGIKLPLRGVNRHQDRAERGNALLPEHHREDAAIIEEIGANAVRLAHYPQADEFYSEMDRRGIVVWAEIPFIGPGGYNDRGFNDLPAFKENGRQQLRELIRQNYNHPAICFWGIFNELKTHGDNPTPYVAELNTIAHEEDSTRLTTAASFLGASDPINGVTDLIAWNQYFGWYGGSADDLGRWFDATHAAFPQYCIGLSEYGAGASVYHQQDSVKPGIASGWWHPENYQTYYHITNWKAINERPYVWGSFVWNLFDFGAAHRTEGDRPGINDKGLVTFDRKTRKDAFYFYKANWNKDEPFVYIANRRHERRSNAVTDVTVFTNRKEVELTLNGRSLGRKKADEYGTATFTGVRLQTGANTLTASSASTPADSVTWHLAE